MKIAVTVTNCQQIGIETYRDFHTTKVFEEIATLKEIDEWIKSIVKHASISDAIISTIAE